MKYVKNFSEFLSEAKQNKIEVIKNLIINKKVLSNNSLDFVLQFTPEYDFKPIFDFLRNYKKPDIVNMVVDIPGICKINIFKDSVYFEESGNHHTFNNIKKYSLDYSYLQNSIVKAWYQRSLIDYNLSKVIKIVCRAAYIDKINWPINVVPPPNNTPSSREPNFNTLFNPLKDKEDLSTWVNSAPTRYLYLGLTNVEDSLIDPVKKINDLSPKTINISMTVLEDSDTSNIITKQISTKLKIKDLDPASYYDVDLDETEVEILNNWMISINASPDNIKIITSLEAGWVKKSVDEIYNDMKPSKRKKIIKWKNQSGEERLAWFDNI